MASVDHILINTATMHTVIRITALFQEHNIITMVNGAQAMDWIYLNFTRMDPDIYTGAWTVIEHR